MQNLSSYPVLTDEEEEWLVDASDDDQASWLILSEHPDSELHFEVNCLEPTFFFDFEDIIGQYRAVGVDNWDEFKAKADEFDYVIRFESDPSGVFEYEAMLDDEPSVGLNSHFPDTIKGWLPFQAKEFNRLRHLSWGLAVWSTGTGKTALATGLIKHHKEHVDASLVVVKRHNKIPTMRKLKKLGDIDSFWVWGPPNKRQKIYDEFIAELEAGNSPVLVLNYEKFRDDFVELETYEDEDGGEHERLVPNAYGRAIFEDRKLTILWDEMPMKLKTRTTALYKAVCCCLYATTPPQIKADKFRPNKTWQYLLSATPVERDPEDVYNCIRLMDQGKTFGPVKQWRDKYVKSYSFFNQHQPEEFHEVDQMFLKLYAHMSVVDKKDPEIASMFPEMIEEPLYIEWDAKERKTYDQIEKLVREQLAENPNPLALMGVMQMFCDLPSMINVSAANRSEFEEEMIAFMDTGDGKPPDPKGAELAYEIAIRLGELNNDKAMKLKELKYLVTEKHPDAKICVFSTFNDLLLPKLAAYLDEWGVKNVIYSESQSEKKRQEAIDIFASDPNIRVFLSSDAGSDSIDLEMASVTADYTMPWNHSRIVQRRNRTSRVTSEHDTIYAYSLVMADSIEERRIERLAQKLGYHEGIFHGVSHDQIKSTRLDKGDFLYILTGSDDLEDL